jgi:hypothetical protein
MTTWLRLDGVAGIPAVNVCIARRDLEELRFVDGCTTEKALAERVSSCIARMWEPEFLGVQVCAIAYDVIRDMLIVTCVHQCFKKTLQCYELPQYRLERRDEDGIMEWYINKEPVNY